MKMRNIKTVFVDLDDTIWWFSRNSLISLRHIFDTYGLNRYADYEEFDRLYHEVNNHLWSLYHYGKITKDYLVTERFRYPLEKIGYPFISRVGEINDEYLHFLSLQPLTVTGAEEMLSHLNRIYDVNVLSNGFKEVQQRKLISSGIDRYIHQVILSDDCGITKPLRGIFDYALSRCIAEAESSVMIGDNYDTDICGAKNAGWRTIFFNKDARDGKFPAADAIVTTLAEVKNVL